MPFMRTCKTESIFYLDFEAQPGVAGSQTERRARMRSDQRPHHHTRGGTSMSTTRYTHRSTIARAITLAWLAFAFTPRLAMAFPFAYTPAGQVIDTSTDTVVATISGLHGATTLGVVLHPNGTRLYMMRSSEVQVIDTSTNSVI